MASGNFECCLAVTLKWEGGYSNHPDDPGGPTMRGVIQREYDAWRRKQGKRVRPVRQIEEDELCEIYRSEYWDAMNCGSLATGMDLCVFDAAVNSGVKRARAGALKPTKSTRSAISGLAFCRALAAFGASSAPAGGAGLTASGTRRISWRARALPLCRTAVRCTRA